MASITVTVAEDKVQENPTLTLNSASEKNTSVRKWQRPYDRNLFTDLEVVPNVTEEALAELDRINYKYKRLLPWGPPKGWKMPPLVEIDHIDVGLNADPAMPNLMSSGATFSEISPPLGTEVKGIQISQMTDAQKDELALFTAQRGVVIFRDQDLVDLPNDKLIEFGEYYGPLHLHHFGGHAKGYPGLTGVYRDGYKSLSDAHVRGNVSTVMWHTDMSYEINTVGTTFLCHLTGPSSGGDTVFASMVTAYEKLSPQFQAFLETLSAVHSGVKQYAKASDTTGVIRDPIETIHPLVRVHPVTGKKSLWVNPAYTSKIVGLKEEESNAILGMLFLHTQMGQDFHIRAHWKPGTVVVYDNRITQHSAISDFRPEDKTRRHLLRLTPHAERPRSTQFKE